MIQIHLLFVLVGCRFLETALALPNDAAQYTLLSQGHYKHELVEVTDALKEAEIIPTVIDDLLPSLLLDVNWSSSDFATLGNTLKTKKLQDEPSITLIRPPTPRAVCYSATNLTYTITLTDPDAPSRHDPKWSEFLHWIATGLVVSDTTGTSCLSRHTLSLTDLKDLVPYHPPNPPKKTGRHRYVFLVFAPENGTTGPLHLTKPDDREHWGYDYDGERVGVRKWAAENGLMPVAANFVYAQHKKQ